MSSIVPIPSFGSLIFIQYLSLHQLNLLEKRMLPPHHQVLETGYTDQAYVTSRILSPGHKYWFTNKHVIQCGPLRMKEAVALNS